MENLRQKYNDLNSETAQLFSELLKEGNGKINLYENDTDIEEYFNVAKYYQFYDDFACQTFDAFILSVSNEGILIAESNDTEDQYTLKLSDLANLQDKISLVEEMQILLNKK